MKRIRSGRGIGDNLYLQSIARHLVKAKHKLQVCTDYPELFPLAVTFAPWTRAGIDITCHYTYNIKNQSTNQFQDCCKLAGVSGVELKLDWQQKNTALLDSIKSKANGRPILFVNGARAPFNRTDNYGVELMPDGGVYESVIARLKKRFFSIYCGKVARVHNVHVDLDLHGTTSVTDLVDIASISSAFFGQCSFVIPLAESFDRPMLALWSARGLASHDQHIRSLTPAKVFCKPTSTHIVDNWDHERINAVINKFCHF